MNFYYLGRKGQLSQELHFAAARVNSIQDTFIYVGDPVYPALSRLAPGAYHYRSFIDEDIGNRRDGTLEPVPIWDLIQAKYNFFNEVKNLQIFRQNVKFLKNQISNVN